MDSPAFFAELVTEELLISDDIADAKPLVLGNIEIYAVPNSVLNISTSF